MRELLSKLDHQTNLIAFLFLFQSATIGVSAQTLGSDVVSPRSVTRALYGIVTLKPGAPFDWQRFRSLIMPVLDVSEDNVAFRSGSVELHGTLMLPAGRGPFPAVVFLHGSGPATRDGARPYAEEFAKLGIASLFFDKRGSGSSTGSWTRSSLQDLANDALAAVEFLKSDQRIDSKRIGFWGVSQAGWVSTLAASQTSDIAFIIVISGGGVSPRESELFSYRRTFEKANLSLSDTAEAMEVIGQYFEYLATGEDRDDIVARLERSKNKSWYKYAPLDRILPSEENRPNWSWVASWDPLPHIEKITCPVLLMFGDKDDNNPTVLSVKKWREGLTKGGNKNITLMIFPGAGHGIRVGEHSHKAPFADGYKEAMLGWLWKHVAQAGS